MGKMARKIPKGWRRLRIGQTIPKGYKCSYDNITWEDGGNMHSGKKYSNSFIPFIVPAKSKKKPQRKPRKGGRGG